MLNILYIGKFCDGAIYESKVKDKNPYFVAQYSFEETIIDGLESHDDISLDIISIYQPKFFPKEKAFIRPKASEKCRYFNFVNVPLIRDICFFISAFLKIIFWFILNRKKEKLIFLATYYPPVAFAALLISKLFGVKNVLTLTDLPAYSYSQKNIRDYPFLKRLLVPAYAFLVKKLLHHFYSYLLLTEPMNNLVNPKKKRYLVLEGVYNAKYENGRQRSRAYDNLSICYAGTLDSRFGVGTIINSFLILDKPDVELWLIGSGDMDREIKSLSESYKNIKYFGFLPREEAINTISQSTLLINLRDPGEEYTKYSFPSKIIEYMATGRPLLTTKLQGIPLEYFDYVYSVDYHSDSHISETIGKIIEMDEDILSQKGWRAKKFIEENKNSQVQGEKIYNFLRSLVER